MKKIALLLTVLIGFVSFAQSQNNKGLEDEIIALYNEGMLTSFDLKVFLEGPFNGGTMNANLNPEPIPLSQPYNDPQKWNYQGTESVSGIPNTDIVDWVLIELRETSGDASTAIADSMIARKAAFLLKDGSVVDLDGESPIYFDNEITDNLYVVVYHRNHLPIMTSQPLTKVNNGYSWDFTISGDQAYGTDAQADLGGVYGMIGGDSDANGIVSFDDKDIDWSGDAGKTGYYPSDLNMDKEVNNSDKNDVWESNLGNISQLPLSSSWNCGDAFIDSRDGQSYATVQIGSQCWMTKNMNIGMMINSSNNQTDNGTIEKYCYENSTANCDIYGGLYQWDEMMQYVTDTAVQGICPSGWHLSTDYEWMVLEEEVESTTGVNWNTNGWRGTDAGGNLKEAGTSHWLSPNTGATNSSGFTGLPGGSRSPTGTFIHLTYFANFWVSNQAGSYAWHRTLAYNNAQVDRNNLVHKVYGFSVRCVRN
jgi:uncharacterized protein (TIGR02145 family)